VPRGNDIGYTCVAATAAFCIAVTLKKLQHWPTEKRLDRTSFSAMTNDSIHVRGGPKIGPFLNFITPACDDIESCVSRDVFNTSIRCGVITTAALLNSWFDASFTVSGTYRTLQQCKRMRFR